MSAVLKRLWQELKLNLYSRTASWYYRHPTAINHLSISFCYYGLQLQLYKFVVVFCYIDVRVFNPFAPTNLKHQLGSCYHLHEMEKRRQYDERVREVERGSFAPLVFATSGGMGKQATVFFKQSFAHVSFSTIIRRHYTYIIIICVCDCYIMNCIKISCYIVYFCTKTAANTPQFA